MQPGGLLPVGLIVRSRGYCTASSVGGWVSVLGRVGVCGVCLGMPPGGLIVGVVVCWAFSCCCGGVMLLICA